jgi:hypothetical protein
MLDAKAVFVDHATMWDMPSVRDMAAVTCAPAWNQAEQSIDGVIRLYARPDLQWLPAVLDQLIEDQAEGREVPDVGLSLSFFGRHDYVDVGEEPGEQYERVTTEITHVESCDIVFGPGANGRVREMLSKVGGDAPSTEVLHMEPEVVVNEEPEEASPPVAPQPVPSATSDVSALGSQMAAMAAQIERLTAALATQAEGSAVRGMGVAPRAQDRPRIGGMLSSVDQIALAYEQLMGLPVSGPVHRLSGIRELYLLLTGDREFQGRIDPELVPQQLAYSNSCANADTTTMAELTRNVMAKVLVQQLDLLREYQWRRRLVTDKPVSVFGKKLVK